MINEHEQPRSHPLQLNKTTKNTPSTVAVGVKEVFEGGQGRPPQQEQGEAEEKEKKGPLFVLPRGLPLVLPGRQC